jgi:hypothetical protein
MSEKMNLPNNVIEMLHTSCLMSGNIFSKNPIEETEFIILSARFGQFVMEDKLTGKRHPTIQFLVKNEDMKRARWTCGFKEESITL